MARSSDRPDAETAFARWMDSQARKAAEGARDWRHNWRGVGGARRDWTRIRRPKVTRKE